MRGFVLPEETATLRRIRASNGGDENRFPTARTHACCPSAACYRRNVVQISRVLNDPFTSCLCPRSPPKLEPKGIDYFGAT